MMDKVRKPNISEPWYVFNTWATLMELIISLFEFQASDSTCIENPYSTHVIRIMYSIKIYKKSQIRMNTDHLSITAKP
jgi:hypothetical protein